MREKGRDRCNNNTLPSPLSLVMGRLWSRILLRWQTFLLRVQLAAFASALFSVSRRFCVFLFTFLKLVALISEYSVL